MSKNIFQIQIALKNFKPKIWRRILIRSDMPLSDFHKVIQTTMGWTNSHLHQFIKDGTFYTVRLSEDSMWNEMNNVDYSGKRIKDLLSTEKDKIVYEYDFGDGWEHDLILEKILTNADDISTPVCTAGKQNCPPEDCGGVWGYADMLEILDNPKHEEHETYIEWLGGEFNPDQFDKDKVNELLKERDFGCIELFD